MSKRNPQKMKKKKKEKKKQKGDNQNVGSTPIPDEAIWLVWALNYKWQHYSEQEIYEFLQECNMSYWEAHIKLLRKDLRDYYRFEFNGRRRYYIQDQLHEAKSKDGKEQVTADAQEYNPWTSVRILVEILLEVLYSMGVMATIALLEYLLELPLTRWLRATIDRSDSNSQSNDQLHEAKSKHDEEKLAASGPSVFIPPTTSKPCSDLGSRSNDMQVGRDATVEEHHEGRVGESCKSLRNNYSVGGVGATKILSSTDVQNVCSTLSASDLPESGTHPNAAQANSQQVYADAQEYYLCTSGHDLVEILLEVQQIMVDRGTIVRCDSNSQFNDTRSFPSTSQGGSSSRTIPSSPGRPLNDFQQSQQGLRQSERRTSEDYKDQTAGNSQVTSHRQSHQQGVQDPNLHRFEMESSQHQEQNPGRSLEYSNLHQSQMGASQGYNDETPSPESFESPRHGQPRQHWEQ